MLRFLIFFSMLFVQRSVTYAQFQMDSLRTVWADENLPDTFRLKALHKLAFDGFIYTQPDSAIFYARREYEFAAERNLKKEMALALNTIGVAYYFLSDHGRALDYYHRSLELKQEIGNKKSIAIALSNIGNVYDAWGDYFKALDYYHQALKLDEESGSYKGIASNLMNIGSIFKAQGEYQRALEYFRRSLEISEEHEFQNSINNNLIYIGIVYDALEDYQNALKMYEQALEMAEKRGNANNVSVCLNNIGILHKKNKNYPEALEYFNRSIAITQKLGDRSGLANSTNNIGAVYNDLNQPQKALEWCNKGLSIARETKEKEYIREACDCLYLAYKNLGNAEQALYFHEHKSFLTDSLFNLESTKKLTQLEMQYEFDKAELAAKAEQDIKDAIAEQKLRRQKLVRNGFIGGFTVVLSFAGVFFTQRNRISKEKGRSEALLLNILPQEVAEELKEKGYSEAQLIDEVSVLFTDFKGFTALSEQLSPKDLVEDLHACFSEFDRICEKYGIEKIKTIGDAYMAAGGLPSPNSTHAKDVVKAALEMAEVVRKGKIKKIAANLPFFEVRIGVHTGPVVAGIVGIKKFQYDIWGDTVNTASRMESNGEVGRVNISEATYNYLKDEGYFRFESRGEIEVKGKGKLAMYFVDL